MSRWCGAYWSFHDEATAAPSFGPMKDNGCNKQTKESEKVLLGDLLLGGKQDLSVQSLCKWNSM